MLRRALTLIGSVSLVYLGFGLIQIVFLNVSVTLFIIIIYAFAVKRLLATVRFTPVLKLTVIKKILHFGLFTLLSRLSYLINYQAGRLIIGAVLGVSWVTYYVVPFMIVERITMLTVRRGMVVFPAISELQGLRRYDTIRDLYLTSSRVVLAVATSICLPLMVFGGRLMGLWMGPSFEKESGVVIVLITSGLYLSALTNVPTFVVEGLGKPKISGISSVSNAFIHVAMIIPFAKHLGIKGVAAAFLVSNACVAPVFIWYVNNRIVKIPLMKLLREAYAKPLLASLFVLIPSICIPQHRIVSLFTLAMVIVISFLGYFFVSSLIGVFPKQERRVVFEYSRMVLKKMLGYCRMMIRPLI
jgi:O-antigen/teichoic acid export membrane protein